MRIQHNLMAQNSYRQYGRNTSSLNKNLEKLSSGYKINRAADDAAGLAVSEKMRMQITGLDSALDNAKDGVGLIQTAEGALQEVQDMLNRAKNLATRSANGTYSEQERQALDDELQALKTEIDRIGKTANFNGVRLFPEGESTGIVTQRFNYKLSVDLTARTCQIATADGASAALDTSGVAAGYKLLAEKIATEYFPNAVTQILDAFPALKAEIGTDTIEMELEIGYIDGSNNTLAYAQYSFTGQAGSRPVNMLIRVDTSDFSDASLNNSDLEMLESTMAHELMHSVMQYTMTDEMSGRTGAAQEFPDWFVEGTAQLAGGGFPTNWNATLESIAKRLSDGTDTAQDTAIGNYLASYTVDNRPYGHGYLAAAYLGYLANGGGTVSGAGIAAGMDSIFDSILNGDTLFEAVAATTGITATSMAGLTAEINKLFSNKDTSLVEFVRQLAYESKGGAGSVIAASLATGGGDIVGDTATTSPFTVTKVTYTSGLKPPSADTIQLAVGLSGPADIIDVDLFKMNSDALGLENTNVLTTTDSLAAMSNVTSAINSVSAIRGYYGALQNRLEHTMENISVMRENMTDAESTIRDTDMAEEMMAYTKNGILVQSAQAMLAQANQVPQGVLSLLN